GKHRTAQQDAIFVAFMERHPIISKNYLKGDKQAAEAAWRRLTNELNSVGPPIKEVSEWKRVWKDWKSCIRKKITSNRLENSKATGKGSLYQDTLTPLEDAVAVICDLYDMADTTTEGCPKDQAEMSHGVSLKFIKTDQDDSTVTDNQDYEDEDCSINIRRLGGHYPRQENGSIESLEASRVIGGTFGGRYIRWKLIWWYIWWEIHLVEANLVVHLVEANLVVLKEEASLGYTL
ncbi:GD11923, partial [Drosophila simulans]